MEKILVEIYVPVLEKAFDVFIPREAPVSEVLELIKKAVFALSDGRFAPDEATVLCRRSDGSIININASVFELDIRNGSKLMLI